MTNKLKTLRDLRIDINDEYDLISERKLKAEALKWVKEMQRLPTPLLTDISYWIRFFNLTEEDLK